MLKKLASNKKSKAQGLVEFALILTLLLTLLYGIMETSRLLFIYASTVTAARQATRYGSATGNNSDTPPKPYYQDCAGIRAAAQRVGFLAPYTAANIFITYDRGLDASGNVVYIPGYSINNQLTCETLAGLGTSPIKTGDRVVVCVETQWNPIVGFLVPLGWSGNETNCNGIGTVPANTIIKRSERTIISSVSIGVTAMPGQWAGSTPGDISLSGSFSPESYDTVGQVIKYKFTITNIGTVDLQGAFTITASNMFVTCGAGVTLFPGYTLICYGYYTITQADLDAVNVVSVISASSSDALSNTITLTTPSNQKPRLTLAISANPTETSDEGAVIDYTYTLKNTGNVTLSSPITYTVEHTYPVLGVVTCPSPATLAPGVSFDCSEHKTYSVTVDDIDAGEIVNTARLTYAPNVPNPQSAQVTVVTTALPLTITAIPAIATTVGQVIQYTYTIRNNSDHTLGDIGIVATNHRFDAACVDTSIVSGGSTTCTVDYIITQADMDAGADILKNTAYAEGDGGNIKSLDVIAYLPIAQTDGLALTISATTDVVTAGATTVTAITDSILSFNYKLTNTGKTTLTSPYTIDPSTIRNGLTPLSITCGTGDLLPGASTSANFCFSDPISPISPISLEPADFDGTYSSNKYITNYAQAHATTKVGTRDVPSGTEAGYVATYDGARLALGITATPVSAQVKFAYTLTNTGNVPITLPASYVINWTITVGGISTAQAPFTCTPTSLTIAIHSSVSCTLGPSYPINTTVTGNLTNTSTAALAANTLPILTDPADITGTVTIAVNTICNITNSGLVPDTNGSNEATWYIYNKTDNTLNISAITIFWNYTMTPKPNLEGIKLSGIDVWTGSSNANGIRIYAGSPSSTVSPWSWPLAVIKNTSIPIKLKFSNPTNSIRIVLEFSQTSPDCSAGLDSGIPAHYELCTWPGLFTLNAPTRIGSDVSLTWSSSSAAIDYQIYYSADNITYNLGPIVGGSPANNIDTITQGNTRYYGVAPRNDCGYGEISNFVSITWPPNRTVSGRITETVTNRIPGDITITGLTGGSCSITATTATYRDYTCTMTEGTGTLVVGAYSTGTTTALNNKVCVPNPVPTYGAPGVRTLTGLNEITNFLFSALSADVPFNILIAQESTTPSGYTCYP